MLADTIVSFVMTADDLITVDVSERVSRVRRLLTEHPIHHVPVLAGNKLVGIMSSTDLLRLGVGVGHADEATLDARLDENFSIEQAMEKHLVTVQPKDTLLRAAQLLAQESFDSLPVVDELGELVGILTTRDLLRQLLAWESEQVD
jgi:CBS domain-containing protein